MIIYSIRERMVLLDFQDLLDLQEIRYDMLYHVINSHDPCTYRDQPVLSQEQ